MALGSVRRCRSLRASSILMHRSLGNGSPWPPWDAIKASTPGRSWEILKGYECESVILSDLECKRMRSREELFDLTDCSGFRSSLAKLEFGGSLSHISRKGRALTPSGSPHLRGFGLGRGYGGRYSTLQGKDQESMSRRPIVAVGMSGGVDSSVAALLLQRQGYEVFGLYMRNWDSRDEAGGGHCTADQDYEDAQRVCKHLGIELHHVDYQKEYWTQVFETFTQKFAMGLTPNPDLACNQYIKFDALLEQALHMGADKLATGHYARLQQAQSGGSVQLLRGIDDSKDQSYFLASVGAAALERVLFPLGTLLKPKVRELAVSEGLVTATKRSSAGICFVGRRNFRDFISEYVEMKPGPFVAVDTNTHLGMHTGMAAYTHGQRAGISGVPKAFYVVGKDVYENIVFVASGAEHPALFCTSAVADDPFWISGEPPQALADGRPLKCMSKARYRQSLEECTVCFSNSTGEEATSIGMGMAGTDSTEFMSSAFCHVHCGNGGQKQQLQVRFAQPTRAITPGQALVLYDGDVCLGASAIAYPGPSLFEQNYST